jgi:hypothetical protein
MDQLQAGDVPALSPQAVMALWNACFWRQEEDRDEDRLRVDGIITSAPFSQTRVTNHAAEIKRLLLELPDQFRRSSGGGWTILNACTDRHGRFWTGEQVVVEQLVLLGLAAGLVTWMLPRDLWSILPGGMPYVRVEDRP